MRLPIVDEKAPNERDFDLLVDELRRLPKETACIFNCQMGKGRTTTGMIIGCLVKHVLHGVGAEETRDQKDEPSFKLIDSILAQLGEEGRSARRLLDIVIDLCGEPPLGTGLQNLRHCILWTKSKWESEPEHKKAFWKHMSVNFIER